MGTLEEEDVTQQELVETQESAIVEGEPDPAAAAAAPAAESDSSAAASNAETPAQDAQFEAGTWNGHPRFECPYCPFAVVAERDGTNQILQHIGQRHTLVRVSSVVGPDGRPIVNLEKR